MDGRVLFRILIFISCSTICFWIDWVRVCKYTKIKGLDSRAKEQKRDERGASFQSSPKINCMLITTRLHTMKVYNTRPVCLPIEVLPIKILLFSTTEVLTCLEVINAFVDRPVPEKLDIFLKLSSQKKNMALWKMFRCCQSRNAGYESRRDAYRQFPRSPLGTPGTMTFLLAHTHGNKKKASSTNDKNYKLVIICELCYCR